jgi:hypothetical protein
MCFLETRSIGPFETSDNAPPVGLKLRKAFRLVEIGPERLIVEIDHIGKNLELIVDVVKHRQVPLAVCLHVTVFKTLLSQLVEVVAAVGVGKANKKVVLFVSECQISYQVGLLDERQFSWVVTSFWRENGGLRVSESEVRVDSESVEWSWQEGQLALERKFKSEDVAGISILKGCDLGILDVSRRSLESPVRR